MLYDSHVHTTHSCDADTTLPEALRAAQEKNVGIVITDHMDIDFPIPAPDFRLDLARYFSEYQPQRDNRVLLGIELGITEKSIADDCAIIRDYDFDYVLGSVHVLCGAEVDDDLYARMDEAAVYRDYLTTCTRLLAQVPVDAFAHIDYPLRTSSKELPYEDYQAEFAALFDLMAARNILLELNTSRLHLAPEVYGNMLRIYRAYQARGGRYVTLGSDAHEPHEIAENFALARRFLQETGLIPVHFENRRMVIDRP